MTSFFKNSVNLSLRNDLKSRKTETMRPNIAFTIAALIIGSASAFLAPTSSRHLSIQEHHIPNSYIATAPAVKRDNSVAIFAKGKKQTDAEDLKTLVLAR